MFNGSIDIYKIDQYVYICMYVFDYSSSMDLQIDISIHICMEFVIYGEN